MIKCLDGVERTPEEFGEWLYNLQELAFTEPNDLTDAEIETLQRVGLLY